MEARPYMAGVQLPLLVNLRVTPNVGNGVLAVPQYYIKRCGISRVDEDIDPYSECTVTPAYKSVPVIPLVLMSLLIYIRQERISGQLGHLWHLWHLWRFLYAEQSVPCRRSLH